MLADKLNETLDEWGVQRSQVLAVVTDNGSNMVKAVRVANEQPEDGDDEGESDIDETDSEEAEETTEPEIEVDTNLYRFPCLAHTLQLVLKELGKNQAYTNLVTKVRAVVRAVKISSVAQEKLIAACGQTVIKDCTTRWNSILLVVDRLLAIRPQLEEVLREMKIDSLTNSEWARLSDIQKLLAPFKSQTDSLQTDTLSLSYVIPSLLELTLHLQDPSLPVSYSNPLLQSLISRFAMFLDPLSTNFNALPAAACYMDPTVSAAMMREDMAPLLNAAKHYIKAQVCSSYFCESL